MAGACTPSCLAGTFALHGLTGDQWSGLPYFGLRVEQDHCSVPGRRREDAHGPAAHPDHWAREVGAHLHEHVRPRC